MTLLNVLIGAAIGFVISGLLFFIHRSSERRQFIDDQNRLSLKEIIDRDRQIKNLNLKINKLAELNSRYLFFMFQIPSIIQRLNTTLKLQEIVASIIELVNNIVFTEKVEIYLFDSSHNQLKQALSWMIPRNRKKFTMPWRRSYRRCRGTPLYHDERALQ